MAGKHLSKTLLETMKNEIQDFQSHNQVLVHPLAGYIPHSAFDTVEREIIGEYSQNGQCPRPICRGQVPDFSTVFPIHKQVGHAIATADVMYGLSTADMSGLGKWKLEAFQDTSKAWQATLWAGARTFDYLSVVSEGGYWATVSGRTTCAPCKCGWSSTAMMLTSACTLVDIDSAAWQIKF